jgi:hypothetical protein
VISEQSSLRAVCTYLVPITEFQASPFLLFPHPFLSTILLIFIPIFSVLKTGMVLNFVSLFESYMIAFMTKEEKEAVSLGKPNLKLKRINKCLILL